MSKYTKQLQCERECFISIISGFTFLLIIAIAFFLIGATIAQRVGNAESSTAVINSPQETYSFPLSTLEPIRLTTTFYDLKLTNGKIVKGRQHWDIAIPEGTTLNAIEDGVVLRTGHENLAGNYIEYATNSGYVVLYGHLQATNPVLKLAGQKIRKGEVIAFSGHEGANSTGAHLHLMIKDLQGNEVFPKLLFPEVKTYVKL